MNCLAFDVGGTNVKYGLIDKDLNILMSNSIFTPKNEESFIAEISKIINENIQELKSVSIAMPGFIDQSNSIYKYGTNIKFSIDFKKLSHFKDFSFHLDNDGNVAAYSEYFLNYKDHYKNLIMLTFGTGIGGGIVANKQLLRGSGSAGEIGHIATSANRKEICNCGKTGCFEATTSAFKWTEAVNALSIKHPESSLSEEFQQYPYGSLIFNKKIQLNDDEIKVRSKIISDISSGLVSLFEIFDNEIFVLGGTMSNEPFDLVDLIEEHIKNKFDFPARNFPIIKISKNKQNAGIIGAAAIALSESK